MKSIKLVFITLLLTLTTSLVFASADQVKGFVERFYETVLNRHSEDAGLNDWSNQLLSLTKSGADIARGFIFSQEFSNRNTTNHDYLTILYKAFFDREPDNTGYNDWIAKLDSSISRETILDGFLYSQEFANLCNTYGISPVKADGIADVKLELSSDIIFRGIVLDDYIKGAKVCADINNDDLCGEGEPFTTTDELGRFIFTQTEYKNVEKYRLIVEGGIDVGTKKPYVGMLSTPAGSNVISPLTSVADALVKEGKSKDEANFIIRKKLGLPDKIEVTKFDPMYHLEYTQDETLKNIARSVLSKQTQLQIIINVGTQTVGASNTQVDIKKVAKSVVKNISKTLISDVNHTIDIFEKNIIRDVLVNSANEINSSTTQKETMLNTYTDVALKIEETAKKAKTEIDAVKPNLEAIKASNAILLVTDTIGESARNAVVGQVDICNSNNNIKTINIEEEYTLEKTAVETTLARPSTDSNVTLTSVSNETH